MSLPVGSSLAFTFHFPLTPTDRSLAPLQRLNTTAWVQHRIQVDLIKLFNDRATPHSVEA